MADSPRWCATCNAYGDHHTDRHSAMLRGASADAVATAPRTLAKATCRVHGSHTPSIRRLGGLYTVELHHIHPLGFGGPDTEDNVVYVCPTGHSAIHELLRAEIKSEGTTSWQVRRHYSKGERNLAFEGYTRIKRAGKLPEVRRTLGLVDG